MHLRNFAIFPGESKILIWTLDSELGIPISARLLQFDIEFNVSMRLINPKTMVVFPPFRDKMDYCPIGLLTLISEYHIIVTFPRRYDTTLYVMKHNVSNQTHESMSRLIFAADDKRVFLATCSDPVNSALVGPFMTEGGSVTSASRLLLSNTSDVSHTYTTRAVLPLPKIYHKKLLSSAADEHGNVVFAEGYTGVNTQVFLYYLFPYFR